MVVKGGREKGRRSIVKYQYWGGSFVVEAETEVVNSPLYAKRG